MTTLTTASNQALDCNKQPEWTQEEAIAYECACEVIGDMIGIYAARIYAEERNPNPDKVKMQRMENEVSRLFQERKNLHVHDHAKIAECRNEYGAIIRAHRGGVRAAIAAAA
jgi:hypothetical protein